MTPEIKRAIKDARFKLDDCRAWLEDTQRMVEQWTTVDQYDELYEDVQDALVDQYAELIEDVQDALISIYQIDQELAKHIKETEDA